MSDYIEKEVVDNYLEHKFHNNYDEHCSECYKNVRMFDNNNGEEDEEEINNEANSLFNIDLERLYEAGRP